MKKLYIGIILAAIFWFFLFAPFTQLSYTIHHQYFWPVMAFATFVLTVFAFNAQRDRLKELFRFEPKHVLIGVAHAIFLYGFSRLGVIIATWMFDWAQPQIEAIYQTRSQLSPFIIAPLLFFWIGPSEEVFWRGFVQNRLMEDLGEWKGTIIAILLYGGVHIWALNPMLLLAAIVLGTHWSIMYKRTKSLWPGIISHALWDTAIFVIFPVTFS
jgi:membrane protease YdiL (CAAX protease family)